jgi:DNA helicase HerA-like ATPase
MNTQVMFRTVNDSDIDAISTYIESAGEDIKGSLPTLPLGNCIIAGLGVPFPLIVEVKK